MNRTDNQIVSNIINSLPEQSRTAIENLIKDFDLELVRVEKM